MKFAITLALALMTIAAQAAVKKAEVKKSAQQQKAEEKRAELRNKAKESPKPKAAEEPASSQQSTGKYFGSMSPGETAKIESGSAHILQVTGTNTTTIVFAWARNAKQKAVLAGVNLVGLYHDDMDLKIPYALTVDGTQTVKNAQGVSAALPVVRPATKAEAEKRGFEDYEIRP